MQRRSLENKKKSIYRKKKIREECYSRFFGYCRVLLSRKLHHTTSPTLIFSCYYLIMTISHFMGKGILCICLQALDNNGIVGYIHFDYYERLTSESSKSKNLLYVTMHNIGHTFGLKHSFDENAVIYTWYRQCQQGSINLSRDDVLENQKVQFWSCVKF